MKKIFLLLSMLALAACSGTAYHNSKIGMTISEPDIRFVPQEASVSINTKEKLAGTAKCSSFLWLFNSVPEYQTYGTPLQVKEGSMVSRDCLAAAVYDAMNQSSADIMVAPQYTTTRSGILCVGSRCLFGTTKVLVKGFPGKITSIGAKGGKK